jgi:hypothetical protein
MQALNSNSVFYAPAPIPTDSQYLAQYIVNELGAIQAAINALAAGHIDKSYAVPTKPREGDIRYADGSTWNPGSGAGIYYYNGSIWKLLG